MPSDPLDEPVRLKTLLQWRREGVLDEASFQQARTLLNPASAWVHWLRLELVLVGMSLVLSGIIFFFAWNWQGIGRFEKLALVEGALLVCVLAALKLGVSRLGGQLLLLAAVVMTGVFLAVFGQIYQTGADAYQLFVGWAALTMVWVLMAQFEALWALWLVILQLGVFLFWMQVVGPSWKWEEDGLFATLAGINLFALGVHEMWKSKVRTAWFRTLLVAALLTLFILPALGVIYSGVENHPLRFLYLPAWLVASLGGYLYFRFLRPDFSCVALLSANIAVLVVSTIGRVLYASQGDAFGLFLLMSLIVVGATAGLTVWLAREYKAMKHLHL